MKRLLTFILSISFTYVFAQRDEIVIGKYYSAQPDSTIEKVFISIQNDLDFTLKDIRLMHDKQPILSVKSIKPGEKKCYSFLKNELIGETVFSLQYGRLVDTIKGTDQVNYNFHKLELSGGGKLLPAKVKHVGNKRDNESEIFHPTDCRYHHQKL